MGDVWVGHTRLSIVDVAGGHQPFATRDGRAAIVVNGEIYNYRELARRTRGWRPRRHDRVAQLIRQ